MTKPLLRTALWWLLILAGLVAMAVTMGVWG